MTKRPRDAADWTGVQFVSMDVGAGNKPKRLILDGYQYATQGERRLAELLKGREIPFTPDVPLKIILPDGRERLFVPDFLFNGQTFVWRGRGKKQLIHGIEVKGKTTGGDFSERAKEKVRLLEQQRGIVVLLMSESTIKQYFYKDNFPLYPLEDG